jgi:hypothetical protein
MLPPSEPHASPVHPERRKVRVCYFNTWAHALEDAMTYVARVPTLDLRPLVVDARNVELMKKARLDCDWYAENVRCFASMTHPSLEFLPAWVTGAPGLIDLARAPREPGEERWLIMSGHQPQSLKETAKRVFELLQRHGVRHLYYAFDEASRFMPCFRDIAPYLEVLIHDEEPLDPAGQAALAPGCRTFHRSWVANFLPFAAPFNESSEPKILFLGSQLGLTDHRKRQIAFLQKRFKDRFVASHDHSVSVAERLTLNRFKVGVCPEGRKFNTPAMSRSHTDRPFWSGCSGIVPVSENSSQGGRLDALAAEGLILRYAHSDLDELAAACDRALELPPADRRRIYDYFNRHETIGTVVVEAIAAAA